MTILQNSPGSLLPDPRVVARQGGSFAGKSPWYEWRRWTGPIWKRPSVGVRWGNDLIAGWVRNPTTSAGRRLSSLGCFFS